jgi:CheY-like chemotaxis protein
MRILICDDEEALLRFLGRVLRGAGYDVLEAHDGREALQLLRLRSCDLVLTDIFMEGQEGIETIRTLRQEWPGLTIIAMSGGGSQGDTDVLTDARVLGADDTLQKPFTSADLLRVVGERHMQSAPMIKASERNDATRLLRASVAKENLLPKDKSL